MVLRQHLYGIKSLRQTVEETRAQDKQLQEKIKVERTMHRRINRETNMTLPGQMQKKLMACSLRLTKGLSGGQI